MQVPNMSSGGCIPFFEIYSCKGLDIRKKFTYPADKQYSQKEPGVIFLLSEKQKQSITLQGDVKILFKHAGFSNKVIFRIMFNTAFI